MTNEKIITNAELMNEAELNQVTGGDWRPPGLVLPGFVPPALSDMRPEKVLQTQKDLRAN